MKLLISIVMWLMLIGNNVPVFAQELGEPVKLWTIYPGYVITKTDDTIRGYLLLKNKISNQGKVFFFDSPNSKEPKAKYKPKDIKAYMVANRYYETMKYSPQNTTMLYSFVLKVIDGPVRFYKSYFDNKERIKVDENDIWNTKIDLSFNEDELQEQWFGSKDGKKLEDFNSFGYLLNFSKNMSKYLADCPEIATKIKNKEKGYEYGNIEKIIREYNQYILSKK